MTEEQSQALLDAIARTMKAYEMTEWGWSAVYNEKTGLLKLNINERKLDQQITEEV